MKSLVTTAVGAFTIAALVTHLLVPPIARLAVALRALDHPGGRRLQDSVVPRLGGVAIGFGLALAAAVSVALGWHDWSSKLLRADLYALGLGLGLVFLVGVIDDLVGVSTAKKFLVEIVAAWLLVRIGWSFSVLRLPGIGEVDLGLWGGVVSVLWIVGVTNAINLIDGLDGLAGGVVAIISISMLVYAVLQRNPGTMVLMAATAGSCLGFLRHNWQPARIFMGDSGSLLLGFLLAAASVHSSLKAPAAVAILVPILALGLPVFDTLLVMLLRFLDRPKGSWGERFLRMFHADRNHIHHLLQNLGADRKRVVGVLYGVAIAFCIAALAVAVTGETTLGICLLGLEFVVILSMRRWGRRARPIEERAVKTLESFETQPTVEDSVLARSSNSR